MTRGTGSEPSDPVALKGETDDGKSASARGFTTNGPCAAASAVNQKHRHKTMRKIRCMKEIQVRTFIYDSVGKRKMHLFDFMRLAVLL
jgi:hypothetical protein